MTTAMSLLAFAFAPPVIENFWLPAGVHMIPGVRAAVEDMLRLVYYRGVYDGALAGVLFASAFWLFVFAIVARRTKA